MDYPTTPPSQHFSWEEVEVTQVRGIDNSIPQALWGVISHTADKMESVKASLDFKPILINSWYRSPSVNARVGGARNSQHMAGEAVDFIVPKFGPPYLVCRRLLKYIDTLSFDQLIFEHTWTHISFVSNPSVKPRKQVLTLLGNGKYASGITDKQGVPL